MTSPTPARRRRWPRFVRRWVLFLGLLWLGAVVVIKSLENRLVYFPLRAAESWDPPPDPRTEDVWLTAADGTKLHAWFLPHDGPGAVLVSHGNGGNLSHRGAADAEPAPRTSAGRSSSTTTPATARATASRPRPAATPPGRRPTGWLTDERKVPADQVVLLGESLGGGVAVELATRHDHEALVLVFTFTSLPAAAKCHYPWLPCGLLDGQPVRQPLEDRQVSPAGVRHPRHGRRGRPVPPGGGALRRRQRAEAVPARSRG